MTNTDLVKRLLDEDVLPYLSPEQVIDLCSEAAAAIIGLGSANKALEARLATIEAATIERCAAALENNPAVSLRALAPLDTEAMVEMVAKAIAADATGCRWEDMTDDQSAWSDWPDWRNWYRERARAALAAMGVGR